MGRESDKLRNYVSQADGYAMGGGAKIPGFFRSRNSIEESVGDKLGQSHFGLFVLGNERDANPEKAISFYFRCPSIYENHSDMNFLNFSYNDAIVDSVHPLAITAAVHEGWNFRKRDEGVDEIKKLLEQHGF